MKKLMILGSAGMLGHMVYYYLKELNKYEIVDSSFSEKLHEGSKLLDVRNDEELLKFITTEKPDVIINCIGILIKGSQTDPSNAIYLNSYLPHRLAKILRTTGGKLIHISTDCVFSGKKGNYAENDFRDADDIYGRSKALGEVINGTDVTLRTSIIGPELKKNGEGLFHWFMQQTGEIKGYTQAYWGGVTTLELAKVINIAIQTDVSGLINVSNGNKISKYDLLLAFKRLWHIEEVKINPYAQYDIDKSLSKSKIFNFKVSEYDEMLHQLHSWMNTNLQLYKTIYFS